LPQKIVRRTGRRAFTRWIALMLIVVLLPLAAACQTPPKKTKATSAARSQNAIRDGSAREGALDLFSASTERFGSDPRVSRPLLVTDTVWIVVVGSVALVSGVALVSAARGARAGRSSRRGT
jgi:general stress protein CsbA